MSSNPCHENFLLYAFFLHLDEICTPFRTYEYKNLEWMEEYINTFASGLGKAKNGRKSVVISLSRQ